MPTRRHFLQTTTALAAAVTAAPWLWQSAQAAEPLLTRKIPR
ncbi:twin-arginine translocation signal domain-containing protein, partial [Vibrio parahaemolyticus]